MKEFFNKLKCLVGIHDWDNIDNYYPSPKEGETIAFSNLHRCRRCSKEQQLGMGVMT